MLKALLARVPFFRQRTSALSDRDQLKADSDARREGWNHVIAEHQKPLGRQEPTPPPPPGAPSGPAPK